MERINLLAVILVTSTVSGGSNLVFRYPPNPRPADRLSRPVYGKKGVQDGGFSLTQNNEKSAAGAGLETGLSQEAEWAYRRESGEACDSDDSLVAAASCDRGRDRAHKAKKTGSSKTREIRRGPRDCALAIGNRRGIDFSSHPDR
jgi:hypothetical protein